jgi:hypothetical protein
MGVTSAGDRERVNHPDWYQHPSGVECIDIVQHYSFNIGNAIKYLWRAGLKDADPTEDLRKARWYITHEIARYAEEPVTTVTAVTMVVPRHAADGDPPGGLGASFTLDDILREAEEGE